MYHISSGWLLHDIPSGFLEKANEITLRGYDEQMKLPVGDFAWSKPLSVDDIVSDICPVRKDLYNAKTRSGLTGRQRNGKKTWGRIAGVIIEEYCRGLLGSFEHLYKDFRKITYRKIIEEADMYSTKFFSQADVARRIEALHAIAATEQLNPPEHLRLTLQYSARNELSAICADWVLGKTRSRKKPGLTERLPIIVDSPSLVIHPDSDHIGISDPSTPDFLLECGDLTVGDIKSGKELKKSHLLTATGYALARESQLDSKGDTNFGIIYFVESHGPAVTSARAYFFVITDALRREFTYKRNEAFEVLSQSIKTSQVPDISKVDRQTRCIHCKFLELCDADRTAQGLPIN